MDLPKIDLATIPGLETAQGLYGSALQLGAAYEESTISVMVYVYEAAPAGLPL